MVTSNSRETSFPASKVTRVGNLLRLTFPSLTRLKFCQDTLTCSLRTELFRTRQPDLWRQVVHNEDRTFLNTVLVPTPAPSTVTPRAFFTVRSGMRVITRDAAGDGSLRVVFTRHEDHLDEQMLFQVHGG